MKIVFEVTNKTRNDMQCTWTVPDKVFIGAGKTVSLRCNQLPCDVYPCTSQYDTFKAEYTKGRIDVKVRTDLKILPVLVKNSMTATKPEIKVKSKPEVKQKIKEEVAVKDSSAASKLDSDRFVKGSADDFKSKPKSIDNNEHKIAEPVTVELFKDGKPIQEPQSMEMGPMEKARMSQAISKMSLEEAMESQHKASEFSIEDNFKTPVTKTRRGRKPKAEAKGRQTKKDN